MSVCEKEGGREKVCVYWLSGKRIERIERERLDHDFVC